MAVADEEYVVVCEEADEKAPCPSLREISAPKIEVSEHDARRGEDRTVKIHDPVEIVPEWESRTVESLDCFAVPNVP